MLGPCLQDVHKLLGDQDAHPRMPSLTSTVKAINAGSRAGWALRGLRGLHQGRVSQTDREKKGNPSRRKSIVQSPGVTNGHCVFRGQ